MRVKKTLWWLLAGIALVGNLSLPYFSDRLLLYFVTPKISTHPTPKTSPSPPPKTLQDYYKDSQWKIISTDKYHAVRVPFELKQSFVYVKGNWQGKIVSCLFDTGASVTIWPQKLNLPHTATGIPATSSWLGGFTSQCEWVIIPSIRFNNFEQKNFPTTMCKSNYAVEEPIIGNDLFLNNVITIDYSKNEFIIRDKNFNVNNYKKHNKLLKSFLYDFTWDTSGHLIINGTLEKQPVRFAIDTGSGIPLVISTEFSNKKLSLKKTTRKTITGNPAGKYKTSVYSGNIRGNLQSLAFNSYGCSIIPLPFEADAILGNPFLSQFKVTIDYSRKKLLLEPISSSHN